MRFYDREKEIAELKRLDDLAGHSAQLTVLMGRRRTGKTTLTIHAHQVTSAWLSSGT